MQAVTITVPSSDLVKPRVLPGMRLPSPITDVSRSRSTSSNRTYRAPRASGTAGRTLAPCPGPQGNRLLPQNFGQSKSGPRHEWTFARLHRRLRSVRLSHCPPGNRRERLQAADKTTHMRRPHRAAPPYPGCTFSQRTMKCAFRSIGLLPSLLPSSETSDLLILLRSGEFEPTTRLHITLVPSVPR